MDLVTPGIGLIFWTTFIFFLLLFILRIFAWKPILNAVKNREASIKSALDSAEKAKEDMKKLLAKNEEILQKARIERDSLMKEAREVKDKIINEAKEKAQQEGAKLLEAARLNIKNEKNAAIAEIKSQVAILSVEIAEKILREKLSRDKEQDALISRLMNDVKIN
jgi:F-type H+-transporting ATPase subunit b